MLTNTTIRPFKLDVPQDRVDDLRVRLRATRWPQPVTQDFSHGQALPLMQQLAAYWADGFDWRAQEAKLNRYPQFTTEIDGQPIHFIHVRSKEAGAFPLILTHGWSSSPADYSSSDPRVMARSAQVLRVGDLARLYGFTDIDGRVVPPFELDAA